MLRTLEDIVFTSGAKGRHAYCPVGKDSGSLSSGVLNCNKTHCICRCHLGPLRVSLWELELEEPEQKNANTLATAAVVGIRTFVSNLESHVFCQHP